MQLSVNKLCGFTTSANHVTCSQTKEISNLDTYDLLRILDTQKLRNQKIRTYLQTQTPRTQNVLRKLELGKSELTFKLQTYRQAFKLSSFQTYRQTYTYKLQTFKLTDLKTSFKLTNFRSFKLQTYKLSNFQASNFQTSNVQTFKLTGTLPNFKQTYKLTNKATNFQRNLQTFIPTNFEIYLQTFKF